MPYDIRSNYGGCSGYAVVSDSGDVKGCHGTRSEAIAQQRALYANEPAAKVTKYRGDLYEQLTPEEKAFHDALLGVVEQYGPFDQGTSSVWVGYEPGSENEDAEIGVKCSNCSFFNPENNGCAILSYQVEPNGKCRLAAIPDGYVNAGLDMEDDDMNDDMDMEMDKRDYNTRQRREMAARGQAMPDGSFPIANRADLANAIQSVGRASNYDSAKRHIMRRARALNAMDMLPEDWTRTSKVWTGNLDPRTARNKTF
jgi:hypothetical protein